MAYRVERQNSDLARWSRNLAVYSLLLLLLTVVLHRFASLHTPSTLNLFGLCLASAGISVALAVWGLVRIWHYGYTGTGKAIVALFVSSLIFAYPAWSLPQILTLPMINDITTDSDSPPAFDSLVQARSPDANSAQYPGYRFAGEQAKAYPDIQPMVLERSNTEAFDIVKEAVRRLKWKVAVTTRPGKDGSPGRIEAEDKTLLLGFVDDIAIRVAGDDSGARIDIRSASRYGRHDLGRNAGRIRLLMAEVKATLVQGEKAAEKLRIKQAKKLKIEKEARRKRQALARAKRQRARARRRKQRSRARRQYNYIQPW